MAAHAMHDEETRKYLQSVKRLMTYAQRIYPTLPSLSLDFNSGFNGRAGRNLQRAECRPSSRECITTSYDAAMPCPLRLLRHPPRLPTLVEK